MGWEGRREGEREIKSKTNNCTTDKQDTPACALTNSSLLLQYTIE